jgi:hypothetical protein
VRISNKHIRHHRASEDQIPRGPTRSLTPCIPLYLQRKFDSCGLPDSDPSRRESLENLSLKPGWWRAPKGDEKSAAKSGNER